MSFYRNQLEDWLKTLHIKADCVLDIGGGSNPVKERVASFDASAYHVMDNMLEELKINVDYNVDLNLTLATAEKMYDVIFCLEVMEYIWNPAQAMININWLSKPNSLLYITFPFVYPVHNPRLYDYLRYTPQGAVKLVEYAGFKVLECIYRIDRSDKLFEFYKADGMHIAGHPNVTGMMITAQREVAK